MVKMDGTIHTIEERIPCWEMMRRKCMAHEKRGMASTLTSLMFPSQSSTTHKMMVVLWKRAQSLKSFLFWTFRQTIAIYMCSIAIPLKHVPLYITNSHIMKNTRVVVNEQSKTVFPPACPTIFNSTVQCSILSCTSFYFGDAIL